MAEDFILLFSDIIQQQLSPENTDNDLIIYPNPASDIVFIKNVKDLNGELNLEIYTSNGSLIKKQSVRFENQLVKIKVNELSSGIYFINVPVGGKNILKRLVKL